MTNEVSLSRRQFLKTASVAVGCGLLGLRQSLADMAGKKNRPNILWLTSEDNSIFWLSCYGGTNCRTPNIDRLAKEGFRYTNCFDNAAVCAPTRSTWITGMYAISNGTNPCAAGTIFHTT